MRLFPFSLIIAAALAGCAPQATPEQQSVFEKNLLRAALSSENQRTVVDRGVYMVEPNRARTFALVTPVRGTSYTIDRFERAAAQFTGCAAKAQPQIYDMMNGDTTVSISRIKLKRTGGSFPIDLTC